MSELPIHPTGYLLINKPVDWTSHDVVAYMRGVTKIKKIGHAGTLDPFATGLLIVAVGRAATKHIDSFKTFSKVYEATMICGATSNTQDLTGTITEYIPTRELPIPQSEVEEVLQTFTGKLQQIPPMFSAKKIKGQKLYELARKGEVVERQPNTITISQNELLNYNWPEIALRAEVSTGSYIRTLCHDIGEALGVGAYCSELTRTSIGPYKLADAIGPKDFTPENWTERLLNPELPTL